MPCTAKPELMFTVSAHRVYSCIWVITSYANSGTPKSGFLRISNLSIIEASDFIDTRVRV